MKTTKNAASSRFPKLQLAPNNNVFLMSTSTIGTCVHSPCGDFLGSHGNINSNGFVDFNGSITLEN